MNHFGFSLCSVGISAGLMAMLFMLMIMPSSTGGFRIYVSLPVEVEDTDTVVTLKQKIEKMTKIPPKQQTIRSEDIPNGQMLVGENKLKDYKISIKSNVYLWTEFQISVWHNGNNYKVITNGTDTVQSLKKKIKPKIERDLNRIIKPIKLRRNRTAGIIELPDNGTLDGCGINGDDDIDVTFVQNQSFAAGKLTMLITITDGMKIEVKYGRKYYNIEVNKKDTVATVKQKIEEIEQFGHIPAKKQTLRWYSNGPVLDDSNKTLEEYGINKGNPIIVSWDEFEIFVQYKGKNTHLW
ncbi:hypothetical protein niasHS_018101 [Heterodera schachtii]|uniref:Ubiquitin-like domain-containing protein n=1 Tax=Heterodera schachtii TaxID=97005 RepID=A0ABD2HSH1_HETSC